METKVIAKACSVIGIVVAAFGGIRYLILAKAVEEMGYFGRNYKVFGLERTKEDWIAVQGNSATFFFIGLLILAFGFLLIYFKNKKES